METRLIAIVLVLAVATAATGAPLIGRAAASSSSASCTQSVEHTAFRTAEAIETVNETGSATSTVSNTKVRIEDTTGFIRLKASNPNGYCVQLTVEIAEEIVAPADLGEVESNSGNETASWRAAQNLSSGVVYTQVELTLPASSSETFAPSEIRVKSLSWTGEAKAKSSGVLDQLKGLWGSDQLEQREYTLEAPNRSDGVTVPLTNNGSTIEEWQATYTIDGETKPVTQDANAPVYYTESQDSSVTFNWNDRDATVAFTADPSWLDKAEHSWTGYSSGWSDLGSWVPFATITAPSEVIG